MKRHSTWGKKGKGRRDYRHEREGGSLAFQKVVLSPFTPRRKRAPLPNVGGKKGKRIPNLATEGGRNPYLPHQTEGKKSRFRASHMLSVPAFQKEEGKKPFSEKREKNEESEREKDRTFANSEKGGYQDIGFKHSLKRRKNSLFEDGEGEKEKKIL